VQKDGQHYNCPTLGLGCKTLIHYDYTGRKSKKKILVPTLAVYQFFFRKNPDFPARPGRNQKRREFNRGWTRINADEEDEERSRGGGKFG
jgi:hypothetical protein